MKWVGLKGDERTSRSAQMTSSAPESDAALLRRIKGGEAEASRLLIDQHLDRIVAYGYRMLGDAAEAEDVAQETFLRLWRNIDKWRAEAPLIYWLQRVAYNLCIDRLRKKTLVSIDLIPEPIDENENPASSVHRAELSHAINRAIAGLPDRQKAAIIFCHQEELSNIETAKIMEISVEAVESLLSRGRRSLRESLEYLRPELKGDI